MLKIHNTLSREKEGFIPLEGTHVGFYSCGPTVYWFQHIGNLRTYIFNDVLKRVLRYDGFSVKHVMNYTDVGHLTSDADEGEDKMEKAVLREHKTAQEIAEYYAKVFEEDCKKLNILPPDVTCKATAHIAEQIAMVETLEKKGFTYRTGDGIYFDTSKFPDYHKLGRLDTENLEEGKRVDIGEKRSKTDFALWKFSEEPGKRQQEWESPWGIGFPGWHIECSAMSSKYLGEQFDIHTGGEDHIQVHHSNEIAQSECCFGKHPWVKYWMHGAFLLFKGEKVSKSKGGLYTISELQELKYDPLDFRYFCLGTVYRKPLNFSIEGLDGAKNTFSRLKTLILALKQKEDTNRIARFDEYLTQFHEAIDDDLNMPQALGVLWEMLRDKELGSKEKLLLAYDFDRVFGLGLADLKEDAKVQATGDVEALLAQRESARAAKDWKEADRLRDEIGKQGYDIVDSKNGPQLKKR